MRLKQYINEMSMGQIDISQIVNKDYIDGLDTSPIEGFLYMYKYTELQMNDPDDDYEDEDGNIIEDEDLVETPEFFEYVQSELESKFEDVKYDIGHITKGGWITIYRKMTVDPKWLNNLKRNKHLGIFWSWDKHAAEAHWGSFGKGHREITLISRVKEIHIDWVDTFQLNISPSTGEEEREIRLFKNTPIKLIAVWVEGENMDISEIEDKVFRA